MGVITQSNHLSSWERLAMAMAEDEEMRVGAGGRTELHRQRRELELEPGEEIPGAVESRRGGTNIREAKD